MNYSYSILPRSLYIHWPFCPYKCHFCNFVALAGHDHYMEEYHNILCLEQENFFQRYQQKLSIDTIFMGGGTPSTYPDDLLLDMFGKLRRNINCDQNVEITIEVNPGTLRQQQLDIWKAVGINRVSIGVQSLNTVILKKLNRHQSTSDVFTALKLLNHYFDALSVDLIIGLPGITVNEWQDLLQQVVTWPVNHISIYFLMVHENTPLYFGVKSQKVTLPCDDEVVDAYYWSIDYIAKHGFEQYEISNFARDGYRSRHNQVYWQHKPFKGFGLGACSFDGSFRYMNEKNLMKYLENIKNKEDITLMKEELTAEQIWLEKLMLGLRQTQGIIIDELMLNIPPEQQHRFRTTCQELITRNLLVVTDQGRLRLTPHALAVENEIIIKLAC